MNILFIMLDQLRHDYLSCAGHPHLQTPHIDALAARGVRFTQAHVQSPVCGASRMSFYTGRYVSSHGAQWNGFPLRVGEMTLGDHLRPLGMGCWLVGKTHMRADAEGNGAARPRPRQRDRRAPGGVRLRRLGARRRPLGRGARRLLRRRPQPLQRVAAGAGLPRRQPLGRLRQRWAEG